MSTTAEFVEGSLTGEANKYKYDVKVSGSSYYDSELDKIIVNVSYSVQAIDKITGQECPLRPYAVNKTMSIALPPDELVTEYNIDIDNNKIVNISIA